MINWDALGVIGGFVTAATAGLYAAIRNNGADTRGTIKDQVENVRGELSSKIDQVGDHLKLQDVKIDDARTRVAHIEGRLGIDVAPPPVAP